jgi:tetratricopeptide (TPR) repeat protein
MTTANRQGFSGAAGGPSAAGDMLQRAVFALNGGRAADAERIAAEVLKTSPRNFMALHVLGSALLMQGRGADAIAPLETAARGGHDPKIETLLAIALRQAGRPDDALTWLKRAIKRRPPHAPAFYEYGCLLTLLKRDDEAIQAFERGLDIAPMMAEISIQLGYVWLRRRNYADAKAAFGRALNSSAAPPGALFGLARAHLETGDIAAAAGYFRRYLTSQPNDSGSWLQLGYCLLELGDRDAGLECFRTAAHGDPKNYGKVLAGMVKSGRGRFWLRPSGAARFLQGAKR